MTNQEPVQDAITVPNLLARIDASWNELNTYIDTLSEAQLTTPVDAAGWTAKDHLIHLVAWEDGIFALLNGESRLEAMGFDENGWSLGYDTMNALIQQRFHDMPLADVRKTMKDHHNQFVNLLKSLHDEDLMRPYQHYDPNALEERHQQPIINWIMGNSAEHYAEHLPWIQAIVAE